MVKFITILRILIPNLSYKYLLFILIVFAGCLYQMIQVIQVYLKFETKIDLSYDQKSEIVIPMISSCKPTKFMFRNSSKNINGLTPAQVYNMTFDFNEIFIQIDFMDSNSTYHRMINLTNEDDQNKSEIHYEKTIRKYIICYHFKYPNSKQLKHKHGNIYSFWLYHQNYQTAYPFYYLFFTSDVNYPNNIYDNYLIIFGNN